eukprot:3658893-Prymnesium_polylepis.1
MTAAPAPAAARAAAAAATSRSAAARCCLRCCSRSRGPVRACAQQRAAAAASTHGVGRIGPHCGARTEHRRSTGRSCRTWFDEMPQPKKATGS